MNFEEREDDLEDDDSRVRLLMESGDMGVRPGQRYPRILGNSVRARIWRAVMGRSEEEHLRGLEEPAEQRFPDRYIRKRWRQPRTQVNCPNARLIGVDQFREAYSAVAYANSLGAILNTHITLAWPRLGYLEDIEASAALQGGLIKHMREWFRHKADPLERPFAWMYVHERSATVGLHTHFLVFIPLEWQAEFEMWLDQRLSRLSRRRPRAEGDVDLNPARPDRPLMHQWLRFGYLMKSVDPNASLPAFPGSAMAMPLTDLVEWAHEGPGEVNCKLRVGIAHEIRASARARAGYLSLLDRGITDVRLLFDDYDYKGWEWDQAEVRGAEIAASAHSDETFFSSQLQMDVESLRERGEQEFHQRLAAWEQMAKDREDAMLHLEERLRAREAQQASTIKAIGELLRRPYAP